MAALTSISLDFSKQSLLFQWRPFQSDHLSGGLFKLILAIFGGIGKMPVNWRQTPGGSGRRNHLFCVALCAVGAVGFCRSAAGHAAGFFISRAGLGAGALALRAASGYAEGGKQRCGANEQGEVFHMFWL
jgi:hypothetical protein